MSNSPASLGVQAKWGFGAANPITQGAEIDFKAGGDNLKAERERVQVDGGRGTRQHLHETTGDGLIRVGGDVAIVPNYTVLSAILPYILGGTATGTSPKTYPLAETLPNFYVTADRGAKVLTYAGCVVNKAVFRFEQGEQLKLILSLAGQTETVGNAGTFPAITIPDDPPFMWSGAVYTFNDTARSVKDSVITIDNHLIVDRFFNNQTATQFPTTELDIGVEATSPFTADEVDLYGVDLAADLGGTITATDGTHTLTFTFARLDWASKTPVVPSRAEIVTPLEFKARKYQTGPTDAISVTL